MEWIVVVLGLAKGFQEHGLPEFDPGRRAAILSRSGLCHCSLGEMSAHTSGLPGVP